MKGQANFGEKGGKIDSAFRKQPNHPDSILHSMRKRNQVGQWRLVKGQKHKKKKDVSIADPPEAQKKKEKSLKVRTHNRREFCNQDPPCKEKKKRKKTSIDRRDSGKEKKKGIMGHAGEKKKGNSRTARKKNSSREGRKQPHGTKA